MPSIAGWGVILRGNCGGGSSTDITGRHFYGKTVSFQGGSRVKSQGLGMFLVNGMPLIIWGNMGICGNDSLFLTNREGRNENQEDFLALQSKQFWH